jgi:hypothetical protein
MSKFASALLAAGLSLAAAFSAHAALVTTDPMTGTTTTFTATGVTGVSAPGTAVVDGITWSGSPQFYYGAASYGLGSNGFWDWSFVATNGTGSITASLGGGFGLAGGFINYAPGWGPALIEALAADGVTVLESYDLTVLAPITTTGGNQGDFRGIARAQNDIYFMRLSGAYILIHSLEVGDAAGRLPEPMSLSLVGLGLLAAGAARRRKQA